MHTRTPSSFRTWNMHLASSKSSLGFHYNGRTFSFCQARHVRSELLQSIDKFRTMGRSPIRGSPSKTNLPFPMQSSAAREARQFRHFLRIKYIQNLDKWIINIMIHMQHMHSDDPLVQTSFVSFIPTPNTNTNHTHKQCHP
jgi:hypothetical protein